MLTKQRLLLRTIATVLCATFMAQELQAAPAMQPAPDTAALQRGLLSDPRTMDIPLDFAQVSELHKGSKDALLIHIQDAHSNTSGQQNLAGALDELMTRYGIKLVLSEGGQGDCSLTKIKKVADPSTWKRVAKTFLLNGEIQGEEYLNLTSEHPMKIVGIEDMKLYGSSLESFAELAERREKAVAHIQRLEIAVEKLKNRLYPAPLKEYEALKKKDAGFEATFSKFLVLQKAAGLSASIGELARFQAAVESGKQVNYELANLERAVLLDELHQKGRSEELESLLKKERGGLGSKGATYAHFKRTFDIARENNIDVSRFTNLKARLDQLEAFAAIDMDALFDEWERAEEELYAKSLGSEDALILRGIDRFLTRLRAAHEIRMTTPEHEAFKASEPSYPVYAIEGFLNRKLAEQGYFDDIIGVDMTLEEARKAIDAFYDSVSERDLAFIQNAEKAMQADGQKVAFLITGGYHTGHLKQLMKEKGFGYAVLTPLVTSETNQKKYEKLILSQRKSDTLREMLLMQDGSRIAKLTEAVGATPLPKISVKMEPSALGSRISWKKISEWITRTSFRSGTVTDSAAAVKVEPAPGASYRNASIEEILRSAADDLADYGLTRRDIDEAYGGMSYLTREGTRDHSFNRAPEDADQLDLIREDLRRLIKDKAASNDRTLNFVFVGIGDSPRELLDTLSMVYETLHASGERSREWKVRVIVLDANQSIIQKTRLITQVLDGRSSGLGDARSGFSQNELKKLAEAVKVIGDKGADLAIEVEYADVAAWQDVQTARRNALKRLGMPTMRADYIFERYVSRINRNLRNDHTRESVYRIFSQKDQYPREFQTMLGMHFRTYLITTNLASAFAGAQTRYVQEAVRIFAHPASDFQIAYFIFPGAKPLSASEYLPESAASAKKFIPDEDPAFEGSTADLGSGVQFIEQPELAWKMTFAQYLKQIGDSLERPAGSRLNGQSPIPFYRTERGLRAIRTVLSVVLIAVPFVLGMWTLYVHHLWIPMLQAGLPLSLWKQISIQVFMALPSVISLHLTSLLAGYLPAFILYSLVKAINKEDWRTFSAALLAGFLVSLALEIIYPTGGVIDWIDVIAGIPGALLGVGATQLIDRFNIEPDDHKTGPAGSRLAVEDAERALSAVFPHKPIRRRTYGEGIEQDVSWVHDEQSNSIWVQPYKKKAIYLRVGRLVVAVRSLEPKIKEAGFPADSLFLYVDEPFEHTPHTALMLALLQATDLHGKTVVDLGSGSGILLLAALALGAEKVLGVERDDKDIVRSQSSLEKMGYQGRLVSGETDLSQALFASGERYALYHGKIEEWLGLSDPSSSLGTERFVLLANLGRYYSASGKLRGYVARSRSVESALLGGYIRSGSEALGHDPYLFRGAGWNTVVARMPGSSFIFAEYEAMRVARPAGSRLAQANPNRRDVLKMFGGTLVATATLQACSPQAPSETPTQVSSSQAPARFGRWDGSQSEKLDRLRGLFAAFDQRARTTGIPASEAEQAYREFYAALFGLIDPAATEFTTGIDASLWDDASVEKLFTNLRAYMASLGALLFYDGVAKTTLTGDGMEPRELTYWHLVDGEVLLNGETSQNGIPVAYSVRGDVLLDQNQLGATYGTVAAIFLPRIEEAVKRYHDNFAQLNTQWPGLGNLTLTQALGQGLAIRNDRDALAFVFARLLAGKPLSEWEGELVEGTGLHEGQHVADARRTDLDEYRLELRARLRSFRDRPWPGLLDSLQSGYDASAPVAWMRAQRAIYEALLAEAMREPARYGISVDPAMGVDTRFQVIAQFDRLAVPANARAVIAAVAIRLGEPDIAHGSRISNEEDAEVITIPENLRDRRNLESLYSDLGLEFDWTSEVIDDKKGRPDSPRETLRVIIVYDDLEIEENARILVFKKIKGNKYIFVADAIATLRGGIVSYPFTNTHVSGKGYMQKAITMMLLKGMILRWESDFSLQIPARKMYKRMAKDPRLFVKERPRSTGWAVTLSNSLSGMIVPLVGIFFLALWPLQGASGLLGLTAFVFYPLALAFTVVMLAQIIQTVLEVALEGGPGDEGWSGIALDLIRDSVLALIAWHGVAPFLAALLPVGMGLVPVYMMFAVFMLQSALTVLESVLLRHRSWRGFLSKSGIVGVIGFLLLYSWPAGFGSWALVSIPQIIQLFGLTSAFTYALLTVSFGWVLYRGLRALLKGALSVPLAAGLAGVLYFGFAKGGFFLIPLDPVSLTLFLWTGLSLFVAWNLSAWLSYRAVEIPLDIVWTPVRILQRAVGSRLAEQPKVILFDIDDMLIGAGDDRDFFEGVTKLVVERFGIENPQDANQFGKDFYLKIFLLGGMQNQNMLFTGRRGFGRSYSERQYLRAVNAALREQFGIKKGFKDLKELHRIVMWDRFEESALKKMDQLYVKIQEVLQEYGIPLSRIGLVSDRIIGDAEILIPLLKQRYPGLFENKGLHFISYERRASKKDGSLFRVVEDALQKMNVRPQEILFIDNSSYNIERARRRGWQTIQHHFEQDPSLLSRALTDKLALTPLMRSKVKMEAAVSDYILLIKSVAGSVPSVAQIDELIRKHGLTPADIPVLAARAAKKLYPAFKMDETWQEIRTIMPHVERLVDMIYENGIKDPDTVILFMARDADVLYAAYQKKYGGKGPKAVLVPASTRLWRSIHEEMEAEAGHQNTVDFLASLGVTEETAGRKYLFIDSGFQGTVPRLMAGAMRKVFAKPSIRGEILLVSSRGTARQLTLKDDESDYEDLKKGLPKTSRVADVGYYPGALNFLLATSLQLMPRFTGTYQKLERAADGSVRAVPDPYDEVREDLDSVRHVNESMHNPVAALAVWLYVRVSVQPSGARLISQVMASFAFWLSAVSFGAGGLAHFMAGPTGIFYAMGLLGTALVIGLVLMGLARFTPLGEVLFASGLGMVMPTLLLPFAHFIFPWVPLIAAIWAVAHFSMSRGGRGGDGRRGPQGSRLAKPSDTAASWLNFLENKDKVNVLTQDNWLLFFRLLFRNEDDLLVDRESLGLERLSEVPEFPAASPAAMEKILRRLAQLWAENGLTEKVCVLEFLLSKASTTTLSPRNLRRTRFMMNRSKALPDLLPYHVIRHAFHLYAEAPHSEKVSGTARYIDNEHLLSNLAELIRRFDSMDEKELSQMILAGYGEDGTPIRITRKTLNLWAIAVALDPYVYPSAKNDDEYGRFDEAAHGWLTRARVVESLLGEGIPSEVLHAVLKQLVGKDFSGEGLADPYNIPPMREFKPSLMIAEPGKRRGHPTEYFDHLHADIEILESGSRVAADRKISGSNLRLHGTLPETVLTTIGSMVGELHEQGRAEQARLDDADRFTYLESRCLEISEYLSASARRMFGPAAAADVIGSTGLRDEHRHEAPPVGQGFMWNNHWVSYLVVGGQHIAIDATAKQYLGLANIDAEVFVSETRAGLEEQLTKHYGGGSWKTYREVFPAPADQADRSIQVAGRSVDLEALLGKEIEITSTIGDGSDKKMEAGVLRRYDINRQTAEVALFFDNGTILERLRSFYIGAGTPATRRVITDLRTAGSHLAEAAVYDVMSTTFKRIVESGGERERSRIFMQIWEEARNKIPGMDEEDAEEAILLIKEQLIAEMTGPQADPTKRAVLIEALLSQAGAYFETVNGFGAATNGLDEEERQEDLLFVSMQAAHALLQVGGIGPEAVGRLLELIESGLAAHHEASGLQAMIDEVEELARKKAPDAEVRRLEMLRQYEAVRRWTMMQAMLLQAASELALRLKADSAVYEQTNALLVKIVLDHEATGEGFYWLRQQAAYRLKDFDTALTQSALDAVIDPSGPARRIPPDSVYIVMNMEAANKDAVSLDLAAGMSLIHIQRRRVYNSIRADTAIFVAAASFEEKRFRVARLLGILDALSDPSLGETQKRMLLERIRDISSDEFALASNILLDCLEDLVNTGGPLSEDARAAFGRIAEAVGRELERSGTKPLQRLFRRDLQAGPERFKELAKKTHIVLGNWHRLKTLKGFGDGARRMSLSRKIIIQSGGGASVAMAGVVDRITNDPALAVISGTDNGGGTLIGRGFNATQRHILSGAPGDIVRFDAEAAVTERVPSSKIIRELLNRRFSSNVGTFSQELEKLYADFSKKARQEHTEDAFEAVFAKLREYAAAADRMGLKPDNNAIKNLIYEGLLEYTRGHGDEFMNPDGIYTGMIEYARLVGAKSFAVLDHPFGNEMIVTGRDGQQYIGQSYYSHTPHGAQSGRHRRAFRMADVDNYYPPVFLHSRVEHVVENAKLILSGLCSWGTSLGILLKNSALVAAMTRNKGDKILLTDPVKDDETRGMSFWESTVQFIETITGKAIQEMWTAVLANSSEGINERPLRPGRDEEGTEARAFNGDLGGYAGPNTPTQKDVTRLKALGLKVKADENVTRVTVTPQRQNPDKFVAQITAIPELLAVELWGLLSGSVQKDLSLPDIVGLIRRQDELEALLAQRGLSWESFGMESIHELAFRPQIAAEMKKWLEKGEIPVWLLNKRDDETWLQYTIRQAVENVTGIRVSSPLLLGQPLEIGQLTPQETASLEFLSAASTDRDPRFPYQRGVALEGSSRMGVIERQNGKVRMLVPYEVLVSGLTPQERIKNLEAAIRFQIRKARMGELPGVHARVLKEMADSEDPAEQEQLKRLGMLSIAVPLMRFLRRSAQEGKVPVIMTDMDGTITPAGTAVDTGLAYLTWLHLTRTPGKKAIVTGQVFEGPYKQVAEPVLEVTRMMKLISARTGVPMPHQAADLQDAAVKDLFIGAASGNAFFRYRRGHGYEKIGQQSMTSTQAALIELAAYMTMPDVGYAVQGHRLELREPYIDPATREVQYAAVAVLPSGRFDARRDFDPPPLARKRRVQAALMEAILRDPAAVMAQLSALLKDDPRAPLNSASIVVKGDQGGEIVIRIPEAEAQNVLQLYLSLKKIPQSEIRPVLIAVQPGGATTNDVSAKSKSFGVEFGQDLIAARSAIRPEDIVTVFIGDEVATYDLDGTQGPGNDFSVAQRMGENRKLRLVIHMGPDGQTLSNTTTSYNPRGLTPASMVEVLASIGIPGAQGRAYVYVNRHAAEIQGRLKKAGLSFASFGVTDVHSISEMTAKEILAVTGITAPSQGSRLIGLGPYDGLALEIWKQLSDGKKGKGEIEQKVQVPDGVMVTLFEIRKHGLETETAQAQALFQRLVSDLQFTGENRINFAWGKKVLFAIENALQHAGSGLIARVTEAGTGRTWVYVMDAREGFPVAEAMFGEHRSDSGNNGQALQRIWDSPDGTWKDWSLVSKRAGTQGEIVRGVQDQRGSSPFEGTPVGTLFAIEIQPTAGSRIAGSNGSMDREVFQALIDRVAATGERHGENAFEAALPDESDREFIRLFRRYNADASNNPFKSISEERIHSLPYAYQVADRIRGLLNDYLASKTWIELASAIQSGDSAGLAVLIRKAVAQSDPSMGLDALAAKVPFRTVAERQRTRQVLAGVMDGMISEVLKTTGTEKLVSADYFAQAAGLNPALVEQRLFSNLSLLTGMKDIIEASIRAALANHPSNRAPLSVTALADITGWNESFITARLKADPSLLEASSRPLAQTPAQIPPDAASYQPVIGRSSLAAPILRAIQYLIPKGKRADTQAVVAYLREYEGMNPIEEQVARVLARSSGLTEVRVKLAVEYLYSKGQRFSITHVAQLAGIQEKTVRNTELPAGFALERDYWVVPAGSRLVSMPTLDEAKGFPSQAHLTQANLTDADRAILAGFAHAKGARLSFAPSFHMAFKGGVAIVVPIGGFSVGIDTIVSDAQGSRLTVLDLGEDVTVLNQPAPAAEDAHSATAEGSFESNQYAQLFFAGRAVLRRSGENPVALIRYIDPEIEAAPIQAIREQRKSLFGEGVFFRIYDSRSGELIADLSDPLPSGVKESEGVVIGDRSQFPRLQQNQRFVPTQSLDARDLAAEFLPLAAVFLAGVVVGRLGSISDNGPAKQFFSRLTQVEDFGESEYKMLLNPLAFVSRAAEYDRISIKSISRIAYDKILQYTQIALQALGQSA